MHFATLFAHFATLQFVIIYAYFKLISAVGTRCRTSSGCGGGGHATCGKWQLVLSCENTFVMATSGSKSLKPKTTTHSQTEGDQARNPLQEVGQRERQPIQGKPHYQNEFMHISQRVRERETTNKQQRRGRGELETVSSYTTLWRS